jgi:transposase-like protein
MFPAQVVITALNKAGSVAELARQMGVIEQTVYNWLNYKHCPSAPRIDDLLAFIENTPRKKSAWEMRQEEIELRSHRAPKVVVEEEPVRAYKPEPVAPIENKPWKQLVEITRISESLKFSFGITDEAKVVFIPPYLTDKLKDDNVQDGDEITLIVRDNDHPNADLFALKWIEEDE